MQERRLAALFLALAWTGAPSAAGPEHSPQSGPTSLSDCDEEVRAQPTQHAAYSCYLRLAHQWGKGRAPVMTHLEGRLREAPGHPFLQLWLGILAHDGSQAPLAESLLRPSADTFRALGAPQGEVLARAELAVLLCYQSREAEAQRQIEQLTTAAEGSGDTELRANALLAAAVCARKGHDHGKAIALNTQALQLLAAAPRSFRTDLLKNQILDGLGSSYSDSGRHREAYEVFLTQSEVVANDPFTLAIVRHRLASQSVNLADQGELAWDEADRRIQESLEMEGKLTGPHWPPYATRILAAARQGASPRAIALLDEALAFWRPRAPWGVLTALRLRAKFTSDLAPANPSPALRDVDEALAMARGSGNHWSVGMALLVRSHVHWRSGERVRASQDALAALDELDRLRDLQVDPLMRAWTGSEASFAYGLVAGWMLDPARGGASEAEVEHAFAAIERHRARALLEALSFARVDLSPPPGPLRDREQEVVAELGRTQRRLLDPGLAPDGRARALGDLTRLERAEEAIRDELARQRPRATTLDRTVPTLRELREALDPDQAFLSFQTWRRQHNQDATFEDGSSWVLAITRDAVRAWRIPDGDQLGHRIRFLLSVIDRRDGSDRPGATALYRDVLSEALGGLPPGVTRLVVAPDGPLHLLPFAALRADLGEPPLGMRYRLSVVPSAALWLRWRAQRLRAAAVPPQSVALVLANSATPPGISGPPGLAERGGAPWVQGLQLQALPFAREEAAAITTALRGRTRVMRDAAASERFLKSTDLRDVGILHLAAHAVVDEDKPERSAVVLEPGSPDEDGLLQLREVTALDLSGKLVVLAACRSSGGMVLGGEGPMSLARAFFQAGAPTVVGSLWQLRDDESAALMKSFYRVLGRGQSISSAMAAAQRERIESGAPIAAWAGMFVLGDGDLLPVPAQPAPLAWPLALLVVGVLAAVVIVRNVVGRRGWVSGRKPDSP